MRDLSATRRIQSVITASAGYFVGDYDKITVEEKPGDMAYVIWYQLWKNGEVVREVNSRLVESVQYFPVED